jgi:hypothetical protein
MMLLPIWTTYQTMDTCSLGITKLVLLCKKGINHLMWYTNAKAEKNMAPHKIALIKIRREVFVLLIGI